MVHLKGAHSVACIVLNDKDGKLLVAKRRNKGQMAERWEFPGGKVEEGESFSESVVREFFEEFSVPVECGALIAETEFEHNGKTVTLHAFRVFLQGTKPFVLSEEHTQTAWVDIDEVKRLHFVDSDLRLFDAVKKYVAGGEA